MGFIYQGKRLCCDFCGTAGARKMACPYKWCQAFATCSACRALKRHRLAMNSHQACRQRAEANALTLRTFKAGGLDLVLEERRNSFASGTSFWVLDDRWYAACCEVFRRTGLEPEQVEQLRAMGHRVTINPLPMITFNCLLSLAQYRGSNQTNMECNERSNEIYRDSAADRRVGDTRPDRWASTDAYCERDEAGRYAYDDLLKGWKQYDTSQDASYFGVWVNVAERKTFTYAEGDRTLVICPTLESFKAELADMARCYGDPPPAFVAYTETAGQWTRHEVYTSRPTAEEAGARGE